MTRLGEYIKELRAAEGSTQQEVADRADISRSYVTHLEAGTRSTASIDVLKSLSQAFGIDVLELLMRVGYLESNEPMPIDDASPLERKLLDVIRSIPTARIRESTLELVIGFATLARNADIAEHPQVQERLRLVAEEAEEYGNDEAQ